MRVHPAILTAVLLACTPGGAVLDEQGGVVVSDDGLLVLEIPPGALDGATRIRLRALPEADWPDEVRETDPVGRVYNLRPDGLELSETATLAFTLLPTDLGDTSDGFPALVGLALHEDLETLDASEATFAVDAGDGRLRAEVDHFSLYWVSASAWGGVVRMLAGLPDPPDLPLGALAPVPVIFTSGTTQPLSAILDGQSVEVPPMGSVEAETTVGCNLLGDPLVLGVHASLTYLGASTLISVQAGFHCGEPACCGLGACTELPPSECVAAGGTWEARYCGDVDSCGVAGCCLDAGCTDVLPGQCTAAGGAVVAAACVDLGPSCEPARLDQPCQVPGYGPDSACLAGTTACEGCAVTCVPDVLPGTLSETCNGVDDDCDGEVDEDFAFSTDPAHCGGCDVDCSAGHTASATCSGGTCVPICEAGWAECADPADPCETDLSRDETCGACDDACDTAADEHCAGDATNGYACDCGAETCAGDPVVCCNGACVDTDTDSAHCGVCGVPCEDDVRFTRTCQDGDCLFEACVAGLAECGGALGDCETDLSRPGTCGDCAVSCDTSLGQACVGDPEGGYACEVTVSPPVVSDVAAEMDGDRPGCVAVDYVLSQPDGVPADVEVAWSTDGGATWSRGVLATATDGFEGVYQLPTSSGGTAHRLLWNPDAVAGASAEVRLQARIGAAAGDPAIPVDVDFVASGPHRVDLAPGPSADALARAITAGLFDGDGHLDLAVANRSQSGSTEYVTVFTGDGAGGFTVANVQTGSAGSSPWAVAAGALDAVAGPDLAVVQLFGGDVTVHGGPSMAALGSYGTLSDPEDVAIGDVNGDGDPDLVTVSGFEDRVQVLLGAGDGTFATQRDVLGANGNLPYTGVAVADLGGDALPDIAFAHSNLGRVRVLVNETTAGSDTLSFRAVDFPVGGALDVWVEDVVVADLDGLGRLDLAATAVLDGTTAVVAVFLADATTGDPSFAEPARHAIGTDVKALAAGDLDGDLDLDLAATMRDAAAVARLWNDGSGGFAVDPSPLPTAAAPSDLVAADLDEDGRDDLAVACFGGRTVTLWLTAGGERETCGSAHAAGVVAGLLAPDPVAVALADFDADGRPDLVGGGRGGVRVWPGDGAGDVGLAYAALVPVGIAAVLPGDVNDDGFLDLLAAGSDGDWPGTALLLRGDGDGGFTWGDGLGGAYPEDQVALGGSGTRDAALADLDGDGLPDLVAVNEVTDDLTVLINAVTPGPAQGPMAFAAPVAHAVGDGPTALVVADVDDDGLLDVVTADAGDDAVSVLPGTGAGTLGPATSRPVGVHPVDVAAGDLDGDGLLEIVTANDGDATITVLRGTGGDGDSYATLLLPTAVALADADGDGDLDLLVAIDRSAQSGLGVEGRVQVWVNDGVGGLAAGAEVPVGVDPAALAVADTDGDGLSDLAVANRASGVVTLHGAGGSGAYGTPAVVATGGAVLDVAIGDLDGDLDGDVALTREGTGFSTTSAIATLWGDGGVLGTPEVQSTVDGRLLDVEIAHPYPPPADAAAVVASRTRSNPGDIVEALLGDPWTPQGFVADYTTGLAVEVGALRGASMPGDLVVSVGTSLFVHFGSDPDADPDTLDVAWPDAPDETLMLGGGSFYDQVRARDVLLGDLDGDALPELIATTIPSGFTTEQRQIRVYRNQYPSTPTFVLAQQTELAAPHSNPGALALGDLDGDDLPEVLVGVERTWYSPLSPQTDQVLVLHNASMLGDPLLEVGDAIDVGLGIIRVATGDLDDDDHLDAVVLSGDADQAVLLLGQGDGTFLRDGQRLVGHRPRALAVGDLDGDGRAEALVGGALADGLVLLTRGQ